MNDNFIYFLSWYSEHWILGLVSLLIVCFSLVACCGAIARGRNSEEN